MSRPDGNTKDGSIPLGIEWHRCPRDNNLTNCTNDCKKCDLGYIEDKGFTQKMLDDFF